MNHPLLIAQSATVYFSPRAKKRFLTKRAAAQAEAKSLLSKKYPYERAENDVGFSGWGWRDDERLCRVYDRLWRKILKRGFSEAAA